MLESICGFMNANSTPITPNPTPPPTPYPSSKRRVQEDIIDTFMGGVEEYLQQLRRKK